LTIHDAFLCFVEHALENFGSDHLTDAAPFLWDFAEQFGDLDIDEVGVRHVREFVRQPKEGRHGIRYWPLGVRRRAAKAVQGALAWAAQRAG
jgi:hypothetical protein